MRLMQIDTLALQVCVTPSPAHSVLIVRFGKATPPTNLLFSWGHVTRWREVHQIDVE